MAFVPAPNTIEVQFNWETSQGFIGSNKLHWRYGDTVTSTVMEELAMAIDAHLADGTEDKPWGINVWVRNLYLRDLTSEFSHVLDYGIGNGTAGDVATDNAPGQVTLALGLRTGLAGPSRRGRIFLVGMCDGQFTGNTLTAGVGSDILGFWGQFLFIPYSEGFELVVVSKVSDGVPRVSALITPVNTLVLSDSRADTQKRRLKLPGLA